MKRIGIAGALGLALLTTAHANEVVIPGSFAVSESGAATYSIDIDVPPGTAGIEPKLSLTYSSQGGNGLLGMGWSLSGLSSITRCPKTVAQDGVRGAVRFDANDRFCLDGQRLIAASGAYGTSGTEYRTEMEGFSRITSTGTSGTGPTSFTVETKSGLTMTYGGTTDSRLHPASNASVMTWSLNRVEDTVGNYMTLTYERIAADSFQYPTRIDYTGNGSAPTSSSVRFVYETRSDQPLTFHAGSQIRMSKRLTFVTSYVGEGAIQSLILGYAQSPDTGRSRISIVHKCNRFGQCQPPTYPSYATAPFDRYTVSGNVAGLNGQLPAHTSTEGDFNGDGQTDTLFNYSDIYGRSLAPDSRVLLLSNGLMNGTFQGIYNVNGQNGQRVQNAPSAGDFNGDGLTDILWEDDETNGRTWGNLYFWISNGDGTFVNQPPSTSSGIPGVNTLRHHMRLTGDFNGDGKTDLLYTRTDVYGRTESPGTRILLLSNGDGTFQANYNVANLDGQMIQYAPSVADFNGDGAQDIFWDCQDVHGRTCGNFSLWMSNRDGTFTHHEITNVPPPSPVPALATHRQLLGDFNGDGKTDILFTYSDAYGRAVGQATRVLLLSKGDGSFHVVSNVNGQDGQLIQYSPTAVDFNGDGLSDVHWMNTDQYGRTSGNHILWISNGDGTFSQEFTMVGGPPGTLPSTTVPSSMPRYGDFNADGRTDVLWIGANPYGQSTGTRELWLSTSGTPDLLTSIDDGFGTKVQLTYKTLTDSSVYTKGAGAAYPEVDLQVPSYVVSRAEVRDGIGGFVPTEYRYGGLRARADGRGSVGFAWTEAEQVETDFVARREYRQDYPYLGRIWRETTSAPNVGLAGVLSEKTYSFACLDPVNGLGCVEAAGNRYFPYASSIVEKGWDLDGSVLPTVTTTNAYDSWGNATQIDVVTSDGFSKSTTNTYTNDAVNWILGRLTRTEVTDVSP